MSLHDIGLKYNTDKATFHKYLDFYEKKLPKRDFSGRLLEIGIMDGASIRMWREYYPNAEIVGIDTGLQSDLRIEGATLLELDGTKPTELKKLGKFDIIIDDGSHMTADQQKSFNWLYYKQLNKGGVYILEDLHTSLIPAYVNSKKTTLEFLDRLNIKVIHYRRDPDEVDSMTCVIKAGQ